MGNITRDPEVRITPKGVSVCQFGLAINHTWKDDAGQSREDTTFVDITAFGRQGETIQKYVGKGAPLYVQGRLKLDQWEDKHTGAKRSKLSVILTSFQFLGGRNERGEGYQPDAPDDYDQDRRPPPSRTPPRGTRPPPGEVDEDVPF